MWVYEITKGKDGEIQKKIVWKESVAEVEVDEATEPPVVEKPKRAYNRKQKEAEANEAV